MDPIIPEIIFLFFFLLYIFFVQFVERCLENVSDKFPLSPVEAKANLLHSSTGLFGNVVNLFFLRHGADEKGFSDSINCMFTMFLLARCCYAVQCIISSSLIHFNAELMNRQKNNQFSILFLLNSNMEILMAKQRRKTSVKK